MTLVEHFRDPVAAFERRDALRAEGHDVTVVWGPSEQEPYAVVSLDIAEDLAGDEYISVVEVPDPRVPTCDGYTMQEGQSDAL